ncbi:hypothetical protein [Macrococcus lamae]|uniref:hypothetical protein n=1 Tax=Macrococcus lamae TaxID=198484 RepID=UPI00140D1027|nr:hypothetical protein [Macrococcus lamae]
MTDEKIEEFKDDAQQAAGNSSSNETSTNNKEKVDSLENDNSGDEQTKDDIQQSFEQ